MTAATYAQHFSTRTTPQSEKISGSKQVANSAGGYAFPVDDWTRLDRFLILGNEGGSYYATEQKLTIENAQSVMNCAKADGSRTVARIVEISEAGRAPKNDPAIFALAICAGQKIPEALAAIPKVCRIGTHLFQFLEAAKAFRGRAFNRAVRSWYTEKPVADLAYQLVKYQQRNGWSHRDILRLCKPSGAEGPLNTAFRWAVGKVTEFPTEFAKDDPLAQIYAFEAAKRADKKALCRLIREYNMPREAVPTEHLTDADVWDALLERMPMTAMVRNLATMTRVGLLKPMSAAVGKVLAELANVDRIRKSRLHPLALLIAARTYAAGHGERSSNTWNPVSQVVDALDAAFYTAFANVESTGKRWLLALDVSGSMAGGSIAGVPNLTPRVGSAAMALVTAATEPQHQFVAFTSNGAMARRSMHRGFNSGLTPLSLSPRQRIDDVCKQVAALPMGGTDCALPMLYAMEQKIPVDAFVVYTDSETWAGDIHPTQAIRQYREKMGIAAKLIVIGMVSNGFTIADPDDGGMMDVVGFDAAAPQIMADFAATR